MNGGGGEIRKHNLGARLRGNYYLFARAETGRGRDGVDQRARTHGGLQVVQSGLRASKSPKHGQKQQSRLV